MVVHEGEEERLEVGGEVAAGSAAVGGGGESLVGQGQRIGIIPKTQATSRFMIESRRHSFHFGDPCPWPISTSLRVLATTIRRAYGGGMS